MDKQEILQVKENPNITMATNGYPGDKPTGTMWRVDIPKLTVSRSLMHYMADTYGGQSGSPVYFQDKHGNIFFNKLVS